jgi:hypothetical protein
MSLFTYIRAVSLIIFLSISFWIGGCTSPPLAPPPTPQEIMRRDRVLSSELASQIEFHFKFKKDT